MRDQKLRYSIGKLIDDKMTSAFDLYEAVRARNELLGQFGGGAADGTIRGSPDVER